MKIKFEIKKIKDVKADALASVAYEDSAQTKLQWLNTLFKGSLDSLIDSKDFLAEHSKNIVVYVHNDIKSKRLLLGGLGKSKDINLDKLRRAYASMAKKLNSLKLKVVGIEVPDLAQIKSIINVPLNDIMQAIAEGIFLSQYHFKKYSSEDPPVLFEEVIFFTDSPKYNHEINSALKTAKIIGDAVSTCRDLGNEPSNQLTPEKFADIVKKLAPKAGYTVTVYDEKKIKQLNMGGVIGVSQGSVNPPRFLILQYFGSSKSEKPIVLVGKGVTFDTGGVSLKPSVGMEAMKMDMCGAGAVVGAFEAVSRLHLKINLIGLIPCVENMPDGNAMRPGDIIKSYSNISIEVLNTDAEGRLILADALGYAANYKPKAVVDIATLTGAALITFGNSLAGVMGTNHELITNLFEAGEKSFERLWELPLYEDFEKMMKSEVADIKNIGPARKAGTIMGGIFLKKFVDNKYPWAHIDIAGTAMNSETSDISPTEATGFGVRLFVEFLRHIHLN